jgi:3-hydroxybutyryl-CoA dehydrogenase
MEVKTIGIVGAGQMGSGIAQVSAAAGLAVIMYDINAEAIERGKAAIAASLERLVKKDKLAAGEAEAIRNRISGTLQLEDLGAADFLVEAATENLATKLAILASVDRVAAPGAVIATNTSSLSITRLAAALADPGRLVGMHFFNPVPMLPLVEIIRGLQTSDAAAEATEALARQIGKEPIAVRNSPGFVVNRILVPMINEAVFVLQEKLATAEQIDAGMKLGASHPIGPLALADLIGLDTLLAVMEQFYRDFNDPKYRPAPLLKEMVDAGYHGRKSGRGFYTY